MRVRILDLAERSLVAGSDFYEQQDEGLGEYFLRSLSADIEALRFHARVHRRVGGFHRCPAKRFPHVSYPSLTGDLASVEAVLDSRRDPAWVRRRLRGS